MYPTKMEINGKIYNINTDYRVALACFRAIQDDEITELEKYYALETLIFGKDVCFNMEEKPIVIEKIIKYLRCGREENTPTEEIDYDYLQDEIDTRTSIRQCYHINLNEMKYLHWYEYNELISGLTEDSLISQIREIRNKDPQEIQDEKERTKLIELQKRIAIKKKHKKTEQEKELDEFWDKIIGGENND